MKLGINTMAGNRIQIREYLQLIPLFLVPLIIFLPGFSDFPYPSPEAEYSDLAISHYPNALYLKRALAEWRTIPMWSPTILSGYPFFANPLSGLLYPPGWLALIFPLPLGFNVMVVLHLLGGGLGMYRLLRKMNFGHLAGLFGSLAFLSMPKIFAQYGAGHLTLVYAVCWSPWLIGIRNRVSGVRYWRAGVVLSLIFLADPRWAPYAGLLWLGYVFAHRQHVGCATSSATPPTTNHQPQTSNFQILASTIKYLLANTLFAALLASPLAIPLLEFSRLSTRSALAAEDVFAHSLPPVRLLGLLFPDFGGFHEWMLYLGGVVLVLMIVAWVTGYPRREVRFWSVVFGAALIFSLGSNIPLMEYLAVIPGFDLLRVPARGLFLACIAGVVLSAYAIESLLKLDESRNARRLSLIIVALAAFSSMIAIGVKLLTGKWALNFLWGAGAVLLATLWVLLFPRVRLPRQTWFAGLLLLSLLDWSIINASLISFRNPQSVFMEGQKVAEFLESDDLFRVYSPSYSVPQQTAVGSSLELADGVDPMQIAAYAEFMNSATGVSSEGYSVTLPPFADGDPKSANENYLPDAKLLGLLNVAYVAADYNVNVDGLAFVENIEGTRIYQNEIHYPRAWIQPNLDEPAEDVFPVERMDWRPNRVIIEAAGPGVLVLSEVYYPGWRVRVDGETVQIEKFQGVLRAVQLNGGQHSIEFIFRPMSLYIGLVCCALGILWLVLVRRKYD